MNRRVKMGRLVHGVPKRRRPRFGWGWLLAVLVLLSVGVGFLIASGWLPGQFVPRKVVIRGCYLTSAPELMTLIGLSPGDTYFELGGKGRSYDPDADRWVGAVHVRPAWGRMAIIDASERHPLLRVVAGSAKYWLCDDGWLVRMDVDNDHGGVFDRIRHLPNVNMSTDPGDNLLPEAPDILLIAAACNEVMPQEIKLIELTPRGEYVLYDDGNLPIHLGRPVDLQEKIGALPKALRLCEEDREKLMYLDASDPDIFYEKWTEPQV